MANKVYLLYSPFLNGTSELCLIRCNGNNDDEELVFQGEGNDRSKLIADLITELEAFMNNDVAFFSHRQEKIAYYKSYSREVLCAFLEKLKNNMDAPQKD